MQNQPQPFGEFLAQRLNTKERLQMVVWAIVLIAAVVLAFAIKPEFGAIFLVIVLGMLVWIYFSVRATWRKSQS
jgi:uncharacterized membrane protein YwaF